MSITDRLFDDSVFAAPGTPRPHHLVGPLLRELGVARVSRDEQVAALRDWARTNEVSPALALSAELAGLSSAFVVERATA